MTEISPTAQASRFGEHARQLVGRTLFVFLIISKTVQGIFITPMYQRHASHTLASRAHGPRHIVGTARHHYSIVVGQRCCMDTLYGRVHMSMQCNAPGRVCFVSSCHGVLTAQCGGFRQVPGPPPGALPG